MLQQEKQINYQIYLSVFILNLFIVAYFWSILGVNYTPVNDGWVSVVFQDAGRYDAHLFIDRCLDYRSNPRVMRDIPFVLAGISEINVITLSNILLFSINVFTGFGIFLIFTNFFPNKLLFCAISSLLTMYYPYDGTMFWLGAFGVNIGFLFCIYSLYFFFVSINSHSNSFFALSIFFLIISCRSYSGHLPLLATVFCIQLFIARYKIKLWWWKAILYVAFYVLILSSYVLSMLSGVGRESAVIDLGAIDILNGFFHAIIHVFYGNIIELIQADMFESGFFLIVLPAIFVFYFISQFDYKDNKKYIACMSDDYKKKMPMLFIIAVLVLVAGYVPYAISDIRYGTDRQLLFARHGVVLLYVAILFWLVPLILRFARMVDITIIVLSAIILGLSVQSKAKLAEEYAAASRMERIFLGDLADCIPSIKGNPSVLLYFDDNDIVVNKKAAMLLNRPSYPVRYLYKRTDLDVTTTNPFYMKKFGAEIEGEFLIVRNSKMLINNTIVLSYSLSQGFKVLDSLQILSKTGDQLLQNIPSHVFIDKDADLTDRQKWFVDERDRLVELSGLRRSTSP